MGVYSSECRFRLCSLLGTAVKYRLPESLSTAVVPKERECPSESVREHCIRLQTEESLVSIEWVEILFGNRQAFPAFGLFN